MTTLQEIRERHEGECGPGKAVCVNTETTVMLCHDREFLLAEVDRLKALCGRAAQSVSEYIVEDYPFDQVSPEVLIAELRKASE